MIVIVLDGAVVSVIKVIKTGLNPKMIREAPAQVGPDASGAGFRAHGIRNGLRGSGGLSPRRVLNVWRKGQQTKSHRADEVLSCR